MSGGIQFGGRTVFVRKAARDLDIQPSVLCKILSGSTDPRTLSVKRAQTLTAYFELGTIEAFISAITQRRDTLSPT